MADNGDGDEGSEMSGMEGYLHKQSGGKQGSSSKGELLRKWDKRYFVVLAGSTSLKYYKTKEEYTGKRSASGSVNVQSSVLRVERQGTTGLLHIVTPARTLSVRTDSSVILEHWVHALSSGSRAQKVARAADTNSSPAKQVCGTSASPSVVSGGAGGSTPTLKVCHVQPGRVSHRQIDSQKHRQIDRQKGTHPPTHPPTCPPTHPPTHPRIHSHTMLVYLPILLLRPTRVTRSIPTNRSRCCC